MSNCEEDRVFLSSALSDKNFTFYTVGMPAAPMQLEGFAFYEQDGEFNRGKKGEREGLPVEFLLSQTSGGLLRFKTNSKRFAVRALLYNSTRAPHVPDSGTCGLRAYADGVYTGHFFPHPDHMNCVADECGLRGQEISLYFPTFSGVSQLEIGLDEGALLLPPTPHKVELPIVFYGSSITQGGCAPGAGTSYTALLGRWLDAEVLNFGFSAGALGEHAVGNMIKNLQMSLFVLDYDHNAPDAAFLMKTHRSFFDLIRAANLTVPIIIMSRPDIRSDDEKHLKRREAVRATYESALLEGDTNVYFIDGEELWAGKDRWDCSADGCHPNALGFMRMAERVYKTIKEENLLPIAAQNQGGAYDV